jgi:hypothetical protein
MITETPASVNEILLLINSDLWLDIRHIIPKRTTKTDKWSNSKYEHPFSGTHKFPGSLFKLRRKFGFGFYLIFHKNIVSGESSGRQKLLAIAA